jgi:hypothetical protein
MIEIPIVIICFNNYKFVDMMINQIQQFDYKYNVPIWIINNNSTCKLTKNYLNKLESIHNVINCDINYGHDVWAKEHIFNKLPDKFIITDPDLKFNNLLPANYFEVLVNLSTKYNAERIGFALDISEPDKIFPYKFSDFKSEWSHIPGICESQKQYWTQRIDDNDYELYSTPIDTTFNLFNKNNIKGPSIRIAGNFTCKHLPWYIDIDGISRYQRYMMFNDANDSSSIKHFELQYIKDKNISEVKKNKEIFLIDENNYNKYLFWREIVSDWEPDLFFILDKYLNKEKQFLNIGDETGCISLYASRYSNHVVNIEPKLNTEDYNNLIDLFKMNYCDVNIDIETSLLSINTIAVKYKLDNLSIININIDGNEENILEEYYSFCFDNKIPLLVKFNYNLWKNKDLKRFTFLNEYQREKISNILNNQSCYILFKYT